MNRLIQISFVFSLFVIDNILQVLFPVDFEMRRLFFVSSLGIVGLMLTLQKMPFQQALLIALGVGFSMDVIRYGYFFMYTLTYALTIFIVWFWSNQVNDSFIELTILSILTIFTKEIILFILMRIIGQSQLSLLNWFIYREFLTLVIHVPLVMGILFLHHRRNDLLAGRERRKRKAEDPLYMTIGRRT